MSEKIGVYVCHCGTNIAGTVDVEQVAQWAGNKLKEQWRGHCTGLQVHVLQPGSGTDRKGYQGTGADPRCSCCLLPHLHEKTFRTACANAGLNPYLCELVSIREQVSWVHSDKEAGTAKSKAVVAGGVERVASQRVTRTAQGSHSSQTRLW